MNIGSNMAIDCIVPVIFLNRYVLAEGDFITVLVDKGKELICEIAFNEPNDNTLTDVTKTKAGIITVADKTGKFIYKIRPGSETSIVFGKIEQGGHTIVITDKEIRANGSILRNNVAKGAAGIIVNEDGSVGLGGSLPPDSIKSLATFYNDIKKNR